ncbi:MAG TPA: hypothetical protein VJ719_13715 [Chthoniobacterales bacterium]|nr:hypothetical protein [Chthoniobacterales bacterium]
MSLIPSESLNFPDSFRAKVGWRLDEIDEPQAPGSPAEGPAAIDQPFPQTFASPPAVAESNLPISSPAFKPAPAPVFKQAPPAPVKMSPEQPGGQQMELLPKTAIEPKPGEAAPGTAEMNALLKHFLAVGAAPSIAPAQPNGKTMGPDENVATVSGVIPTNVAVESPGNVVSPNESVTGEPGRADLRSDSLPPEPQKTPAIPGNPPHSQQSIVAALESLAHTDVEAPIGSVDIQTPAQANHILELIAAAVQRGALVGETVPEPSESIPDPPVMPPSVAATPASNLPAKSPSPDSSFAIARPAASQPAEPPRAATPIVSVPSPVVPEPVSIPEPPPAVTKKVAPIRAPLPTPASPAAEPISRPQPAAESAGAPNITPPTKVPAKIRITPRKIKPRAQVQPVEDAPLATPISHDVPANVSPQPTANPVVDRRRPEPPVEAETKPSPKPLEPAEKSMPRPELSARKIAAARLELAQSDLSLFSARERRNRWIGFGLSEFAILTALILLGRYGFTHHFPDPTLKLLVFILILAAAAVAVALPIAFFRNDPKRWNRVDQ